MNELYFTENHYYAKAGLLRLKGYTVAGSPMAGD
jgi:hypothetical protein